LISDRVNISLKYFPIDPGNTWDLRKKNASISSIGAVIGLRRCIRRSWQHRVSSLSGERLSQKWQTLDIAIRYEFIGQINFALTLTQSFPYRAT